MEYHSIVSKFSYVFDQYIFYRLVPENGYRYDLKERELTITYEYTSTTTQEQRERLFDFLRKGARGMIRLDAYSKVILRQCSPEGDEFVEEFY